MIPNPRLAALEKFIGTWTTVGSHSMMPGITLHGRTSFEWYEGGAYVCIRTAIDEPGIPSAIALVGSDDAVEGLTMLYFDERTVSRRFDVAIEGGVLRWSRTAPGFSQRYVLTPSSDGNTLRGVSSFSKDDVAWEQDLELTYTRS